MRNIHGDRNGVYAQVIADSVSPRGDRVTTMEVQCHRFVLAEFNTHRAFSRNSASSRAIPVAKQLKLVQENPALPVSWPSEQRGMQGGEDHDRKIVDELREQWLRARDSAVEAATALSELGLHKSVTNRLLEPFMWHRIIVTATDYANFFIQRCSPLAQPEIRAAADCMRDALRDSRPEFLMQGEWHLPYADDDFDEDSLKISAARCARVSYLTHDGIRDIDKDLELYYRLVAADPPHWSPLEHVCRPSQPHESAEGNLAGWTQLRHIVSVREG